MDLLSNNPDVRLNICHDPQGNTIVSHLEEVLVANAGEIYRVLARGQEKRTVRYFFFFPLFIFLFFIY